MKNITAKLVRNISFPPGATPKHSQQPPLSSLDVKLVAASCRSAGIGNKTAGYSENNTGARYWMTRGYADSCRTEARVGAGFGSGTFKSTRTPTTNAEVIQASPAKSGGYVQVRIDSYSPTQIVDALVEAKGSQRKAATALNVSYDGLRQQVSRAKSGPIFNWKTVTQLDGVIAASMREHENDIGKAAEALRVNPRALKTRIKNAAVLSDLATIPPYSHDYLALIIERHEGDLTAAAKKLGISKASLVGTITNSKESSPLYLYRVTNAMIAGAFKLFGTPSAVAKHFRMPYDTLLCRLRVAGPDSELADHKLPDFSEEQLDTLFEKHGGDRDAIAAELGISKRHLAAFLGGLSTSSILRKWLFSKDKMAEALEKYQGDSGAASREIGCTDTWLLYQTNRESSPERLRRFGKKNILRVLNKHKRNRKAAAQELGMSFSALNQRIGMAPSGSELAEHQYTKDDFQYAVDVYGSQRAAALALGVGKITVFEGLRED
jgi:hypothetical protein